MIPLFVMVVACGGATKPGAYLPSAGSWPPSATAMLGRNSFTVCAGQKHVQLKRTMARLFTAPAVRSYLPGIQRIMGKRLAAWAAAPGGVNAGPEVSIALGPLVLGVSVFQASCINHALLWLDG
jgi:cytochrome P450